MSQPKTGPVALPEGPAGAGPIYAVRGGRLLWLYLLLAGCGGPPPEPMNAAPAVLIVAVRPDPALAAGQGDSLHFVDLYVRDLEGEPVDLVVWVKRGDGPLEEAEIRYDQGHGLLGLHADPTEPGTWHRLVWDSSGLSVEEMVRLRIEPIDRSGNSGSAAETPAFKLSEGWSAGG